MRAVLDANIVVGFLLTKGHITSSIFEYWEHKTFTLLVSDEIVQEFSDVLDRLIKKDLIRTADAKNLLRKINRNAKKIKIRSKLKVSLDKKDDRYIECAKDGKADYIVSRDKKHLLNLVKFRGTKIITPGEFLEILKNVDYRN